MNMPPPPQHGAVPDLASLARKKMFPFNVELQLSDGTKYRIVLMGDGSIVGDPEHVAQFLAGFREGADAMFAITMHSVLWQMRVQGLLEQMAVVIAQAKEDDVSVETAPETAGSV